MRATLSRMQLSRPSVRFAVVISGGVLAMSLFALAADAQGTKKKPSAPSRAAEVIPGEFIVTTKPGANPETVAAETRGRGHKVDHVYKSAAKGFSGKLSPVEVMRLNADPRVERIEPDQVVHALAVQNPAPSWGLDRIDERAPDGISSYTDNALGTTGSGVTAYVIDTGINAASTDLAPRVGSGANFVSSGTTNDCNGHGTHVAGTIGGTKYGVAKSVTLVPVRVLDCGGSGSWAGVIAGLDWVAANHGAGLAVANLSLGGGFSQSVNDAVKRVVDDGVVVAVAAGNESADACGSSPASEPSALTVGATDSADTRASFSNFGSCVDLFAPGVSITSDWIGSATATNTISGTSMASPHVAGAAALYLAAGNSAADLVARVTTGRVVDPGLGSPNKLLYVGTEACSPSSCPPPPPPPANDPFAGAQQLGTSTGATTGVTTYASKEAGEPNHASDIGGRSIWYRFTATAAGTATIDTLGSGFDTLLAVYTGSAVNALTSVASNDDAAPGNLQSRVQFSVTANTTYQVAVDGYGGTAGSVTLNWTLPSGPPPPSGNTGFVGPSAQSADTDGDGNGYETNPGAAFADDGLFAVDTDSGTDTSTKCTSTKKDKHRFSGYGLAVPAGSTVKGIEVQLQARVDGTSGSPKICVQLSWDGGATWTSTKSTARLTTAEATYTLGSATDTWGRAWSTADLGSNFRVRVIDIASSTSRDFSLDRVAVRATY